MTMSKVERLAEDAYVSELFATARTEAPSDGLEARVIAAALGTGAAAAAASSILGAGLHATASGVSATGSGLSLPMAVLAKWFALGLVGGGLAVTATMAALSPAPTANPQPAPFEPHAAAAHSDRSAKSPSPLRARPDQEAIGSHDQEPHPAARPPEAEAVHVERAKAPRDELAGAATPSTLRAEVESLARVRSALRAGDVVGAEHQLARHDEQFRAGRLGPEARYLRMEIALASGDRSAAEALARQILESAPSSPHAGRARVVLGLDRQH